MASVDKVKLGEVTYDVSPSATGTLNGFSSSDNVTPPAWSEVNTISSGDTNSTIFSKLTTMVKNVRWLYAKLGNEDFSATGQSTVTGALSSLQSELDGKSDESHTHSVGSLPVSNNQVNSTSYIPTSALLYSMSMRAEGIESVVNTAKRALLDDPNTRHESKSLGTFAAYDVDMMLSEYTHENNYGDLALGNYFTIQDGTYNVAWEIAGFDMECGQLAADGTVYDNGYGICLIPKHIVTRNKKWNTTDTTTGGYMSSYMHNTVLPGIVNTLKTVFEDHIVNRNVLLSSTVTNGSSSAYTWTTADATLMSVGQMTGTFATHNNKYDDGEANYRLPLFDYEDYWVGNTNWTRCVRDSTQSWYSRGTSSSMDYGTTSASVAVRPLIYIR